MSALFRSSPLAGALLAGLLVGCAADNSDLDAYIDSVKARKSTVVEPMPQVLVYEPYRYSQNSARDPFEPFATAGPSGAAETVSNGLTPDFERNREALEFFPLEGLRMRGTLSFRGEQFAIVQAPDGVVHRVQTGNYMGQNFGRIVTINNAEIILEEIVPDGLGGYVKRDASLALSGDEEA